MLNKKDYKKDDKKEERKEVTCFRVTEEDLKEIRIVVRATKTDASTVMRGFLRLGIAAYLKEGQNDKSEALLRVLRAGSFK